MFRQKGKKYNNKIIINEYGKFDSKKEYQHFLILFERQSRGEISDLERQKKYVLIPPYREEYEKKLKTKVKILSRCIEKECSYFADFTYTENGVTVVEDTKSFITHKNPVFIIKRKLMLNRYGIKIKEV